MTSVKSEQPGFSLIELMVVVAITGILLAVVAPNLRVWLQGSQIRGAAESVLNGIQRARAEAVARNTDVEFVLVQDAAIFWTIKLPGAGGEIITSSPIKENSSSIVLDVFPAGSPATSTITFGSLGTVRVNTPASATISRIDIDSTAYSSVKNLRINISGSSARMCDPHAGSGTVQSCP